MEDCKVVVCPALVLRDHSFLAPAGRPSNATYRHLDVLSVECDAGHVTSDVTTLQCTKTGLWSSAVPNCTRVSCLSHPLVVHGSVTPSQQNYTYNDTITIQCQPGFEIADGVNTVERSCQDNRTWSGPLPDCSRVHCPILTEPPNGFRTGLGLGASASSNTYQSVQTFACDAGHRLTAGNPVLACQRDKTWNGTRPTCTVETCQLLLNSNSHPALGTSPSNHDGSYNYTSVVSVACNVGYETTDNATLTCLPGHRWSSPPPVCKPLTCGPVPMVGNATIITNTNVSAAHIYQDNITVACSNGFAMNDGTTSLLITCQLDKQWSIPAPSCRPIQCPELGQPANGYRSSSDLTFGSVQRFACNQGFVLSGDTAVQCNADQAWNGTLPICSAFLCTPTSPSSATDSTGTSGDSNGNSTREQAFTCPSGFSLVGATTLKCLLNGTWSAPAPACIPLACAAPNNTGRHRSLTSRNLTITGTIVFACDTGYSTRDAVRVTCGADQSWSGPFPVCSPVHCPVPVAGPNVILSVPLSPVFNGAPLVAACESGYQLSSGDLIQTCTSNGSWSGSMVVCSRILCPAIAAPLNGHLRRVQSTYAQGDVLEFTCDPGFRLGGSKQANLTCVKQGIWSHAAPRCEVVDCLVTTLPPQLHQRPAYSPGSYVPFNTTLRYHCDVGYTLLGARTQLCQQAGLWDNALPHCTVVECPNPGLVNHSVRVGDDFTYLQTVTYSCLPGYYADGPTRLECLATGTWTTSKPVCSAYTCNTSFSSPANAITTTSKGAFTPDITLYEDDIIWTRCRYGYASTTATRASCRSGRWMPEFRPDCQPVTCPGSTPDLGANVVHQGTGNSFGDEHSFSCLSGYGWSWPFDFFNISCQADRQWSSTAPDCVRVACPPLPTIADGAWKSGRVGAVFEDTTCAVCHIGYEITGGGTANRTCQANATWSGSDPQCSRVQCSALAPPANGVFSLNEGNRFGDRIRVSCNVGYRLNKADVPLTCLSSRNWSEILPECTHVTCSPPPAAVYPANNSSSSTTTIVISVPPSLPASPLSVFNYTHVHTYNCRPGFQRVGAATTTCDAQGLWSQPPPLCYVATCKTSALSGAISNGLVTGSSPSEVAINATVTWSCELGYELVGQAMCSCQQQLANMSGKWCSSLPSCRRVQCQQYPAVAKAFIVPNAPAPHYNETEHIHCPPGHTLEPGGGRTASAQCRADRTWSYVATACLPSQCAAPPTVPNAHYTGNTWVYSSAVTYTCDHGYVLTAGSQVLLCSTNSTWKGELPNCTVVTCQISNVSSSYPGQHNTTGVSRVRFGTVIRWSCQVGYRLLGSRDQHCTATGRLHVGPPSCQIVTCPGLAPSAHSQLTAISPSNAVNADGCLDYRTLITFQCLSGFESSDNTSVRCLGTGAWSNPAPICRRISCGQYPPVTNGYVRYPSQHYYRDLATVQCNQGYIMPGQAEAVQFECWANRTWSGLVRQCTPVTCPDLGTPHSARLLSGGLTYMSVRVYECNEGYQLFDGTTVSAVVCQSDMAWNSTLPKCKIKRCAALPLDTNTTMITHGMNSSNSDESFDYGSRLTFACEDGFETSDPVSVLCRANSTWSGVAPDCRRVSCETHPAIANATVTPGGSTHLFGDWVAITCHRGFELASGEPQVRRTCQADRRWSGVQPTCQRVSCPDLGQPPNGYRANSALLFGDVQQFVCLKGFVRSGDEYILCQADRTWNGTVAICSAVQCRALTAQPYGMLTGSQNIYNTSVVFSCPTGFTLVGAHVLACMENGQWNSTTPRCLPQQCPPPNNTDEHRTSTSNTTVTNAIMFACADGYVTGDALSVRCQHNQTWSAPFPRCRPVKCAVPQPNSQVLQQLPTLLGEYNGAPLRSSCDVGHQTVYGDTVRYCLASGSWSGRGLICSRKFCNPPSPPANGFLGVNHGYRFGDVAVFRCNSGFELDGKNPDNVTCTSNEVWSHASPNCRPIQCADPGHTANAVRSGGNLSFAESLHYSCRPGFSLVGASSITCTSSRTWSASLPYCQPLMCSPLLAPSHGALSSDNKTFDASVDVTCNAGYLLAPGAVSRLTCTSSLVWSRPTPLCMPIECGNYAVLPNTAVVKPPSLTFNQTAHYSCATGYVTLSGSSTRQCLANKTWSGMALNCHRQPCMDPGTAPNTQRFVFSSSPGGLAYGDSILYSCVRGYEHSSGGRVLGCQAGGYWNDTLLKCRPVECDLSVLSINHGHIEPLFSTLAFGAMAHVVCDAGYQVDLAVNRVECTALRTILEPVPQCVPISCGSPVSCNIGGHRVADGMVSIVGTFLYQSEITFLCSPGYRLIGMRNATCQANGTWTTSAPLCIRKQCPTPVSILNGSFNTTHRDFGGALHFSCDPGFVLVGPRSVVCMSNGVWGASMPSCQPVSCGTPAVGNAVVVTATSLVVGSVASFSCRHGYVVMGTTRTVCEHHGNWSDLSARCVPVDCGMATLAVDGLILTPAVPATTLGNSVNISCPDTHILVGSTRKRVCMPDGHWSGAAPQCVAKLCQRTTCDGWCPASTTPTDLGAGGNLTWFSSPGGSTARLECPNAPPDQFKYASRECRRTDSSREAAWQPANLNSCVFSSRLTLLLNSSLQTIGNDTGRAQTLVHATVLETDYSAEELTLICNLTRHIATLMSSRYSPDLINDTFGLFSHMQTLALGTPGVTSQQHSDSISDCFSQSIRAIMKVVPTAQGATETWSHENIAAYVGCPEPNRDLYFHVGSSSGSRLSIQPTVAGIRSAANLDSGMVLPASLFYGETCADLTTAIVVTRSSVFFRSSTQTNLPLFSSLIYDVNIGDRRTIRLMNNDIKLFFTDVLSPVKYPAKSYRSSCQSRSDSRPLEIRDLWSTEGCSVSNVAENKTHRVVSCACSHLSSFATSLAPARSAAVAVDHIELIVFPASLAFLLFTFLLILCKRKARSQTPGRSVLGVAASIFLVQASHLVVITGRFNGESCKVFSLFINYWLLVALGWSSVLVKHLHSSIVSADKALTPSHTLRTLGIVFGIPGVLVLFEAIATQSSSAHYVENNLCFLGGVPSFCIFYVTPFAAVLFLQIALAVSAVSKGLSKSIIGYRANHRLKLLIRVVPTLPFYLGITWSLAFFVGSGEAKLRLLFTVLNALQGLYVLVLCLLTLRNTTQENDALHAQLFNQLLSKKTSSKADSRECKESVFSRVTLSPKSMQRRAAMSSQEEMEGGMKTPPPTPKNILYQSDEYFTNSLAIAFGKPMECYSPIYARTNSTAGELDDVPEAVPAARSKASLFTVARDALSSRLTPSQSSSHCKSTTALGQLREGVPDGHQREPSALHGHA
ncbi:sushi, von Willebrand factor type A, EGF and pentraxin domain-containing protein 1-like [Sycon ciliatum]|uniref:sushi, von Willebrand factor type A, EGF and pentraxin domain-containing protein 1-like n=1 Tax=Sycon ciliatum TaxID=27933 RepID=UPI0031F6BFD1